jgi:hypothetical protein
MHKPVTAKRYEVNDYHEAIDLYYRNGWTDGLPVIPPTESHVTAFLDFAGLDPEQVIGEVPERARVITGQKLAINAVMAGCLPEYMPILVAVVEAMTDAEYRFNHLASLGSPWPLIIVNGPITKKVGLHSGIYLFGPGSRPNATIARAVSLLFRNCAEAKAEGIQRGQWGNPIRWGGCIAENEETIWTPLHVQRGFHQNESTATVVSVYPGSPSHVTTLMNRPERMLDAVCHAIPNFGGAQWIVGVYTVFIGPHHVDIFVREEWSKTDVRNYLIENSRISIANLKARGLWGVRGEGIIFSEEMHEIQPGDGQRFVYTFKDNGEYQKYLVRRTNVEGRLLDIFVVVAGGDAGHRLALAGPYMASSNPVTKAIRTA